MAMKYTEEQLNNFDKNTLVQLFLVQQDQLQEIDHKLQILIEQVAVLNNKKFGRSSEKLNDNRQLSFTEIDGEIVILFNEAEVLVDEEVKEESTKTISKKRKGKRAEDLKNLVKILVEHTMSEEDLREVFGEDKWKRLPDEVYSRYKFTPAKVEVEEHHVAVYASQKTDKMVKADHPGYLLRNSLVSPSLEAAIMNGKYVNGAPFARLEKEFDRYGLAITRQNMANWTIQCAERYLAVLYDYLHEQLLDYHVIQADETPVQVNRDGRATGAKSYMWAYRTGQNYRDKPIALFDFQKTRKAEHPREFLKGFTGYCVTDGYQVYHKLENEQESLKIAGCWSHARRRFDEATKAMPKDSRVKSLAYLALKQIQAIYREEGKLKDLSSEERLQLRELNVKPLVEAYFKWAKQNVDHVLPKSKTHNGLTYTINQEKYLLRFLEDGNVPMDNNAAEQTIRSFCIGRRNWMVIDTINGAKSSAIVYSIAETAKANKLKPYEYFEHLLSEIPRHLNDTDRGFLEDLLPWSDKLPAKCRK